MTNHWRDIKNADVILIAGANPAEAHPVGFQWFMKAKLDPTKGPGKGGGAKLIHIDPRQYKNSRDQAEGALATAKAASERLTRQLLTFARRQISRPVNIDLNGLLTDFQSLMHQALTARVEMRRSARRIAVRATSSWAESRLPPGMTNFGGSVTSAM